MPTPSGMAPYSEKIIVPVPGAATAASESTVVANPDFVGSITSVTYVPDTAITGVNANTRKVALVNKGQTGAGSTEMASLQYNSGTNGVAFDEQALALSGTPANLDFAANDILAWVSTAVGTGLADPGGTVIIEYSRA